MAMYDRICRTCGVIFKGGSRAWYCPVCRKERKRETTNNYKRRGAARHIGQIDLCENCGAEYTVNNGLQKYCPACQPIMHKELLRKQALAYYHKNKATINPKRNEDRRVPDTRCIICGKDFRRHGREKTCSPECRKDYRNSSMSMVYKQRYKAKEKQKNTEDD